MHLEARAAPATTKNKPKDEDPSALEKLEPASAGRGCTAAERPARTERAGDRRTGAAETKLRPGETSLEPCAAARAISPAAARTAIRATEAIELVRASRSAAAAVVFARAAGRELSNQA
mmetsp:Transcript_15384/g.24549  ORF Transcript_15384/g.24549 Transcript_15384/m.24549 type:complete len:119 (-) Transcript_15384:8-364(-)